ncbi:TonB-dependent receptor [Flavobacterium gilvum]|uniref:TonB-dependent receptor n=1 Tax=Flavobacterium gilvum TaxID=1492737 RepID=A0AAC9N6M3_9FLAO|nr:TonB-dependent receptor [Flavobacterium gilvum]AOW09058.1 TonB-dependent receptor [Flavobacterium gilvum]KFC60610.1 TonB-denpendent receptor [Flavobacterium gilvum]
MKLKFLFFTLFICVIGFSQNKGTITGILLDKDSNNQPLPFANILIKGTKIGANTDVNGKYSIIITPGNYIIQFSFVGYETKEVSVTVVADKTIEVNSTLGSGSYTLKDVVVKSNGGGREKETALLLEQKNAVVIKQSIGAQEMSRKGVSDVEEGLTKITGITKVGSRGLFVRGLEDRYNNLLINDLAAPTNNPFSKIVPLDLFPTNIVGTIDVYKTFNPNIYGDFAGGTFNIQTSKVNKSITKLNLGFGYTTGNSLKDFLLSQDAETTQGFWGFNGSERALPGFLGETASRKTFTTDQALNSINNDKGFSVSESKSPLNTSINLLHAEKFNWKNDQIFSYLLSINYDNNFAVREGVDRTIDLQSSGSKYVNNFITTDYRFKTTNSALVGLNYGTDRLKLSFNTLYLRTTLNSIKDQYGQAGGAAPQNVYLRTNQLDKSDYLNAQLLGEYAITKDKNQTIKAGASFATTKYDQPDRKFITGFKTGEDIISSSYGGNNLLRQYLTVDGNSFYSTMAEYNLKFGNNDKQNKLTVGYNGNGSMMESSYRFISSAGNGFTTNINTIDNQITNDILANKVVFSESSNATYKVKLDEMANAAYTNLFLKFGDKFEVNGGIRFESTLKETHYRTLGSFDSTFKVLKYDNNYFLPSLNVKYLMTETANIRFAASKTYTRPVIMESFPISYINADGTSTQGNSILKNSDNYNADLKYELFPTAKEMITVGLFGKHIINPIEKTFISNATTGTVTTFLNSDNANLFGLETELLIGLDRISENLSNFSWGLNATLMSSKVTVSPTFESIDEDGIITVKPSIETHQSRSLQGASDWLVNSDLKYEFNLNKDWSNTISLVYGVFGKRIYAVGTNGQDHTYELPVQQLNFVWGSKVSEHFDLKFTADNLLNPVRKLEFGNDGTIKVAENSLLANSYKKGIGFSLKLGYSF